MTVDTTKSETEKTPAMDTTAGKIEDLSARRKKLEKGGGDAAIAKRKERGLNTARERVDMLTDDGSFQEMFLHMRHRSTNFGLDKKEMPADGVVTGHGTIDGRVAYIASQDFTVAGGSLGEMHGIKIARALKSAVEGGVPAIVINDSGGARIQEGVGALNSYGQIFYNNVLASGVVPQISIICGPCAGGAAYSPALTDFIIQVRGQKMFITGPGVIKQVTGEEISAEALGGADAQVASGNVHFVAENDQHAFEICRKLLSFLPSNNHEDPPFVGDPGVVDLTVNPELDTLIPDSSRSPYDMRRVIEMTADNADFLEVQAGFAPNVVIGFARYGGHSVGIIANQPQYMAGVLDINASDKAARFIRFCNAFNVPLLTLVDVPGFLPGVAQESGGIIRHGAKMLFAYSAATVPKISVITRKAYGGAYIAMSSSCLGSDRSFAWPSAEIAVMGADGAVPLLYRRELADAEDPAAVTAEKRAEYEEKFNNPYEAAALGMIDDVIKPSETRKCICMALETLKNKRVERPQKKHGNIPM